MAGRESLEVGDARDDTRRVDVSPFVRVDARTRVLRDRTGPVSWELWLRTPPPALAGSIALLWAGDADSPSARHRGLPGASVSMMFNLGHPQRIVPEGRGARARLVRGAFVGGVQERSTIYEAVVRHPRAVAASLTPMGAWAFFGGLPLESLANEVFDLENVLGTEAGVEPLRQRLAEAPDLGAALELLERWVVARLIAGPSLHPLVHQALALLEPREPTARVDSVARSVGTSPRRLHALFRREVGVSPKRVARIHRLDRALDRVIDGDSLATLAVDCGYYDQSHLNRDFREMLGLSPTEAAARAFRVHGWREIAG